MRKEEEYRIHRVRFPQLNQLFNTVGRTITAISNVTYHQLNIGSNAYSKSYV